MCTYMHKQLHQDPEARLPESRCYPIHTAPVKALLRDTDAEGRRQGGGGGADTGPRQRWGHLLHFESKKVTSHRYQNGFSALIPHPLSSPTKLIV